MTLPFKQLIDIFFGIVVFLAIGRVGLGDGADGVTIGLGVGAAIGVPVSFI
jgi:hypothetical protein